MRSMNRREFLGFLAGMGATLSLSKIPAYASDMPKPRERRWVGLRIIDAHEHPDHFYVPNCTSCDSTSTLEKMRTLWMDGSSFAAVGDSESAPSPIKFQGLLRMLQYVRDFEDQGKVFIVRCVSDILPFGSPKRFIPGAILSVEGASPLVIDLTDPTDLGEVEGRVENLYDYGVRLITIMHYLANEIGDVMTSDPVNGGLTQKGEAIVERILDLGMVIDVAHAHIDTLKDIAERAHSRGKPIIDSHTSPSYWDDPYPDPNRPGKPLNTRLRSWAEMEMVVETGGLICTWPLKVARPGKPSNRETILDWAKESLMLKERFGIEHIGLGTDAGGGVPQLVDGWESILNIIDLAEAMREVGFSLPEVRAYMGDNFLRILKQCIG